MVNFKNLIDKEKGLINIKDQLVFTNPDYVPTKIHKFKQLDIIFKNIAELLYKDRTFHTVILGGKGTGKTVSLQYLKEVTNNSEEVRDLLKKQKEDFVIYINCKLHRTTVEILKEIMNLCGYSASNRESAKSHFNKFFKNKKFVIILDEVDMMKYDPRNGSSIFNILSITNSGSVNYSLIAITNDVLWLDEMRDKDADFQAKYYISEDNKISWKKPSTEEILDILKLRILEGVEGKVNEDILQTIASLTSTKYDSNTRLAILSLYRVLLQLEKGKENYDILKIMEENAKGLIKEGLLTRRDTDLVILYLSNFLEGTTDILVALNGFAKISKSPISTVSKPTLLRIVNELSYQNFLSLYKGRSREPDTFKLLISFELVEDDFRRRFSEEGIENLSTIIKNIKSMKSEKNNKSLSQFQK